MNFGGVLIFVDGERSPADTFQEEGSNGRIESQWVSSHGSDIQEPDTLL